MFARQSSTTTLPHLESDRPVFRIQVATLVMLGIVALSLGIVAAWFAGENRTKQIFTQINWLQQNPPFWLEAPMVTGEYLLAPTVILFLIAFAITRLFPQPQRWSRWVVVGLLLVLTIRYILWRSVSTLNLSDPLNGSLSLGLFVMEMVTLTSSVIQLFLLLRVRDRRQQADRMSLAVLDGSFLPSVDIFIPTYNEPDFILQRTVIGCQAMEYPNKNIYLLDDTRRSEIKTLAENLGCHYIIRPDNSHAKAGNINHALRVTKGELIVIFDADFVPTKNFLTRTVGFFQEQKLALVQTPQSFYNSDPIASNLGLENILTSEEEVFYRQIQPMRDGSGSVICAGTSFVVRRTALEEIGGFVTDSLSEDYFTGIRLAAKGYKLIYLDEKLSAGLAAENISAQAVQRLRWARGTLQAFFIKANPLTIPGLSPLQRLGHLEGLLHWFTTIPRIYFLLMPLAYSFLGVIPVRATVDEVLYFFLPYYLVNLTVFGWLNYRSRSAFLSDIYSLVLVFPLALTVIQAMLNPFSKGFKVTPKGMLSTRYSFNWGLALPLIILFGITALTLWRNLGMCMVKGAWQATVPPEIGAQIKGIGLGWLWSGYNLMMVGIALLILLDIPRPDPYVWFDLRRVVRVTIDPNSDNAASNTWWGVTTAISEIGMEVAVTEGGLTALAGNSNLPAILEIEEIQLKITGIVTQIGSEGEFPTLRIMFDPLSMQQRRQLVEMLFCRPGQWRRHESPGEFKSLLILFQVLLRPRVLFERKVQLKPVVVAKT